MDVITLCRRAHGAGVTLTAEGERLLASPAGRLSDELRTEIKAHKPELVQFLLDAHATTTALIEAAMRACDHHGDGEQARLEMRRDCLNTPPHLQQDLLDHFDKTYGSRSPAARGDKR